MRKKQAGQMFILVLILLAIGAMLVVPALRLTGTALKSSQIATRQVKTLYAADAAQEWVLWKLKQPAFTDILTEGVPFTINFDACGANVTATVIMRALEGEGGITLATDDVIRPTKTVSASNPVSPDTPDHVANDSFQTITYTIRLEQLSSNTTQGLDAIYDILPKVFASTEYVMGSSRLRVDEGPWEDVVGDPLKETSGFGGQVRLRWPATGNFASPIRDFVPRQVKELKFQMTHTFSGTAKDKAYPNWVVIKVGDVLTLSGPQAVLIVGSPPDPNVYVDDGLLNTTKTSDPAIIPPGVQTDIQYTITITNQDGLTNQIQKITDYLPPGFEYIGPASGITTIAPVRSLENINGVERWVLSWTTAEFPNGNAVSIASGQTLTLVFWARTIKFVSGLYYNEVVALPNKPVPTIFSSLGINLYDFNATYSWNMGAVMVPAYDSSTEVDGTTVDANMSFTLEGITITSFQFR